MVNVQMAPLIFVIIAAGIQLIYANNATVDVNDTKIHLDPKRRTDLVDEAFLEQKDVLLDMLEQKLKEVANKKKKSADSNAQTNNVENKCDPVPVGDLKMKASGVNAVGEIDVQMKFGNTGKGDLKLDAVGISNIGKTRLELDVEDANIHIPGLNDLFPGKILCKSQKIEMPKDIPNEGDTQQNVTNNVFLSVRNDSGSNTDLNVTKSADEAVTNTVVTGSNVNETTTIPTTSETTKLSEPTTAAVSSSTPAPSPTV